MSGTYLPEKWKLLSHVWLSVTPQTVVYGILQVRIPEWVAFLFSRGSSQPRDWTQVSWIAGGSLQLDWKVWGRNGILCFYCSPWRPAQCWTQRRCWMNTGPGAYVALLLSHASLISSLKVWLAKFQIARWSALTPGHCVHLKNVLWVLQQKRGEDGGGRFALISHYSLQSQRKRTCLDLSIYWSLFLHGSPFYHPSPSVF